MSKPLKWDANFELIHQSIAVSGDDSALIDEEYEIVRCNCQPRFDDEQAMCCLTDACLNYATQTECVKCVKPCGNNRLLKRKFANVEVRDAEGKGFGLFSCEFIERRGLITEYVGEIISQKELDQRFAALEAKKLEKHLYIMQLKPKTFVDARYKGGVARFINHSCDPNARLEIWTVKDRLRLAVFALRDIQPEEEISFDYQWRPGSRPPTVCLCGTAKCRGYIELIKENKKNPSEGLNALQGLTGSWVNCKEREFAGTNNNPDDEGLDYFTTAIFDTNGDIITENLLGKYIKLWNDEQQYFQEMKVEDYNPEEKTYECLDLYRKQIFPIKLQQRSLNWYYFDETIEPKTIKRKEQIEESDESSLEDLRKDSSEEEIVRKPVTSASATKDPVMKALDRFAVKLKRVVIEKLLKSPPDSQTITIPSEPRQLLSVFVHFMERYYHVRGIINRNVAQRYSTGDDVDDNNNNDGKNSFDLEFVGDQEAISTCKAKLRDTIHSLKVQELSRYQQIKQQLLSRQSGIFTYDWRMIPSLPSNNGTTVMAASTSSSQFRNILTWQKEQSKLLFSETFSKSLLNTTEIQYLPSVVYGSSNTDSSSHGSMETTLYCSLSRTIEQTFLKHLKVIMEERLHYSEEMCLQAMLLLSRFLLTLTDTAVKDKVAIIAAMIVLTLKTHQIVVKPSQLKKICQNTYQQIFYLQSQQSSSSSKKESNNNNTNSTSKASEDEMVRRLLPKILEKEIEMYQYFGYDCYLPPTFTMLKGLFYRQEQSITIPERNHLVDIFVSEAIQLSQYLLLHYSSLFLPFAPEVWMNGLLVLLYCHYAGQYQPTVFKIDGILLTKLLPESLWQEYWQHCQITSNALEQVSHYLIQFISFWKENKLTFFKTTTSISTSSASNSSAVNMTIALPPFLDYYIKEIGEDGAVQLTTFDRKNQTMKRNEPVTKKTLSELRQQVSQLLYRVQSARSTSSLEVKDYSYQNSNDSDFLKHRLYSQKQVSIIPRTLNVSDVATTAPSVAEDYLVSAENCRAIDLTSSQVMISFERLKRIGLEYLHWSQRLPVFEFSSTSSSSSTSVMEAPISPLSTGSSTHRDHTTNSTLTTTATATTEQYLLLTVRPIVSTRIMKKEFLRAKHLGLPYDDLFPEILSEMKIFQHLFYLSYRQHSSSSSATANSYFMTPTAQRVKAITFFQEPVGFIHIASNSAAKDELERQSSLDESYVAEEVEENEVEPDPEGEREANREEDMMEGDNHHTDRLQLSTTTTPVKKSHQEVMTTPKTPTTPTATTSVTLPSIPCLLSAPVHVSLATFFDPRLKLNDSSPFLPPVLVLQWIQELMLAIDYLLDCGVMLRSLSLEDLYITTEGVLKIGGLQGAVLSSPSIHHHHHLHAPSHHHASSSSAKKKPHKHGEEENGMTHNNNNNNSSSTNNPLPHSQLAHLMAPEVLFGGPVSAESTIYCLGTVAYQLITGRPLIKNAEKNPVKQIDYLYCMLGTPKANHYYEEFLSLPLASQYPHQLQKKDQTGWTESKSQVFKLLKRSLSEEWQTLFSNYPMGTPAVATTTTKANHTSSDNKPHSHSNSKEHPSRSEKKDRSKDKPHHSHSNSNSNSKEKERETTIESDGQGIIDFLVSCLQFSPKRRKTLSQLFKMNIFQYFAPITSPTTEQRLLMSALDRKEYSLLSESNNSSNVTMLVLPLSKRMEMMKELIEKVRTQALAKAKSEERKKTIRLQKEYDLLLFRFTKERLAALEEEYQASYLSTSTTTTITTTTAANGQANTYPILPPPSVATAYPAYPSNGISPIPAPPLPVSSYYPPVNNPLPYLPPPPTYGYPVAAAYPIPPPVYPNYPTTHHNNSYSYPNSSSGYGLANNTSPVATTTDTTTSVVSDKPPANSPPSNGSEYPSSEKKETNSNSNPPPPPSTTTTANKDRKDSHSHSRDSRDRHHTRRTPTSSSRRNRCRSREGHHHHHHRSDRHRSHSHGRSHHRRSHSRDRHHRNHSGGSKSDRKRGRSRSRSRSGDRRHRSTSHHDRNNRHREEEEEDQKRSRYN